MLNLSDIIKSYSRVGEPSSPEGRMFRFRFIIEEILRHHKGNLLEIGAGNGLTTKIMLELAHYYNRQVLVIDPFEKGWKDMPLSYGQPYPYSKFAETVDGLEDRLTLIKEPSNSGAALSAIMEWGPISFAFLDGLQYKNNVLNELKVLSQNNVLVICLDDATRLTEESQVPLALEEFLKYDNKYEKVETPANLIEGYIVLK